MGFVSSRLMSSKQPIVVTGAAGKTGSVVARELLANGYPVRAIVRRDDRRSATLLEAGADVIVADLHDYAALVPALRGAAAAYYVPPWEPFALESAAAFAAAAIDAGLPAIVELSQWLSSPSHPSQYTRQHWLITRMFATLPNIAHVTINPGFFADNLLILDILRNAAHLGFYAYLSPWTMRNAPPSNEDIGRVAAAVLRNPHEHAGRSYRPTGPALLNGEDVTAILERVLGRRLRVIKPPAALFHRALAASGMSAAQRTDAAEYFRESAAWAVDAPNDVVRRLTGREPEDFETIARRYAAHPALARTLANRLTTLRDFIMTGLLVPQMPQTYRRAAGIIQPAVTMLSSDSPAWLAAHRPATQLPTHQSTPVGARA